MRMAWPVSYRDVVEARARIAPMLAPTPTRNYPLLDRAVGHDIRVWVKHENHQPTGAFKARNALAALTAMDAAARARGVVAATRGNHGQGLAWAGQKLGIAVTVCVPHGNNPEKNEAMRAWGATVISHGRDYDASLAMAEQMVRERGLEMVHSTNDARIVAGAGTIALEMFEQAASDGVVLDALVIAVGGGSQAVGALVVARQLAPQLAVYAVQAEAASAIHDGWHAGKPVEKPSADTFADGLATRACYTLTFGPLCDGLAGFTTASEAEIASAIRLLLEHTHNLAEGAGAAGLAGLCKLAPELRGKTVGVILSGGNIDQATLRRVVTREL